MKVLKEDEAGVPGNWPDAFNLAEFLRNRTSPSRLTAAAQDQPKRARAYDSPEAAPSAVLG